MTRHETGARGAVSSRRGFLKSAALAGAALAGPRILHAANRGDVLRVGILGAGTEGYVLTTTILKCQREQNVQFAAVCDIWPRARNYVADVLGKFPQQTLPVHRYGEYGDMLDGEKGRLDAVIVATPDWVHHEHSIACMEAGLDVYCEKEMSNTIANARAMVLAARRTGRLLQIGHQRRSNPRYLRMHDYVVRQEACGRLTHVSGHWNRHKPLTVMWSPTDAIDPDVLRRHGYESIEHFRNWRWYRKYSGGPIADLGSHQVDIFNWVIGRPPRSVMASGSGDNYPGMEWCDNLIAVYEWDHEVAGQKHVIRGDYELYSTTSNGGFQEDFVGTEGCVAISEAAGKGGLFREFATSVPRWEWDLIRELGKAEAERIVADALACPASTIVVAEDGGVIAVGPSQGQPPGRFYPPIPVPLPAKPEHQPHLENFFAAVRGQAKLTCPPEVGFETAVTVLKVNQAVAAARKLTFQPDEFTV